VGTGDAKPGGIDEADGEGGTSSNNEIILSWTITPDGFERVMIHMYVTHFQQPTLYPSSLPPDLDSATVLLLRQQQDRDRAGWIAQPLMIRLTLFC
jgi:hypothetical protein